MSPSLTTDRSKREFFWNLGGLWEWRAMTGDGGFVVLSVWPLCCYFCGMYTNIHTVSYNVFLTDCVHTHRYVWTRNVRSVSGWVSTINIQSIYKIITFSFSLNVVWFSSWRVLHVYIYVHVWETYKNFLVVFRTYPIFICVMKLLWKKKSILKSHYPHFFSLNNKVFC